jgi:hypothetical protein
VLGNPLQLRPAQQFPESGTNLGRVSHIAYGARTPKGRFPAAMFKLANHRNASAFLVLMQRQLPELPQRLPISVLF